METGIFTGENMHDLVQFARKYASYHIEFIEKISEFVDELGYALDEYRKEHDIETHDDIWDRQCERYHLDNCELSHIEKFEDNTIFHFYYTIPYEDFMDHFKVIINDRWEHLTTEEIVRDIFTRSAIEIKEELRLTIESTRDKLRQYEETYSGL